MAPGKSQSGFTLVEMMVTIAVAAVLLATGLPAFRTFIQDGRETTQVNSLVLSLNLARSEAIKRDLPAGVVVCPSTDAATCSGTSAWNLGWIVLAVPAEGPLQSMLPLAGQNTLTESSALTAVTFLPSGLASAAGNFTLCDSRGAAHARQISISSTGRIVAAPTPGRSLTGAALVCP